MLFRKDDEAVMFGVPGTTGSRLTSQCRDEKAVLRGRPSTWLVSRMTCLKAASAQI